MERVEQAKKVAKLVDDNWKEGCDTIVFTHCGDAHLEKDILSLCEKKESIKHVVLIDPYWRKSDQTRDRAEFEVDLMVFDMRSSFTVYTRARKFINSNKFKVGCVVSANYQFGDRSDIGFYNQFLTSLPEGVPVIRYANLERNDKIPVKFDEGALEELPKNTSVKFYSHTSR